MKWHHHCPAGSQHTGGGFVTDSPDRLSVDAQMICHVHRSQEWGRLIARTALATYREKGGEV